MGKHFFTTLPSAEGGVIVQINDLQLSSTNLIKLLQVILIKRGANDIAASYAFILDRARKTLSKTISKGIEDVIQPLYGKFFEFFRVLISMEDGNPVQHVDWTQLEASLLGIDLEVQRLFKQYKALIWSCQSLIFIPFFQTFLLNERTKARVPDCFNNQSIQPILFQMLVNEYEECGITTPQIRAEADSVLIAPDNVLLDTVIENIAALEHNDILSFDTVERTVFRDLAYLKILLTDDFHYFEADSQTWKKCHLTELSRAELSELTHQLLRSTTMNDAKATQRTLLQVLAVLHTLYYDISQTHLCERELASILLAVSQSKIALQWQLDVYQTPPAALLLYTTLLCLRGGVVHIEQAERLLAWDEMSRVFLQCLGVCYTPYLSNTPAKMGLLHLPSIKSQPNTYYFGSQTIQFGCHPALNTYLAQGLLEIKQKGLQAFEVWVALLSSEATQPNIFQSYRASLLESIEKTWIGFVAEHAPYQNLLHVDQMMEAFQKQELGRVWSATEQALLGYAEQQTTNQITQSQLGFLVKESSRLLTIRAPAYYANALPSIKMAGDSTTQQVLLARLYYEQIYWSDADKMHWIQTYLKRQISHLQRLCPDVLKAANASEQLKLFIRYLAQLPKAKLSIECIAATTLSVNLFRCLDTILPWASEVKTQEDIALLSGVSSDMAVKSLAKQMMVQFLWVTETDSFYYQWLESNTVKQAAATLYKAAQRLSSAPTNKKHLKAFLLALTEQQQVLGERRYYIPWGWFWGYPDTHEVLAATLQQVQRMVSLQQLPLHLVNAAEESARCVSVMQNFQAAVEQLQIIPAQKDSFNRVFQQIQIIEASYSGYARLHELRAYLETQRHIFLQTQYSCFYGPKHRDQMNTVINILEQGLISLGQSAITIFTDRNYLAEKAQQIQAQKAGVTAVRIHPTYCQEPFVDVWITSSHTIPNFQPDSKAHNTWYKRFYHINDLCAYTRELRVFTSPMPRQNVPSIPATMTCSK